MVDIIPQFTLVRLAEKIKIPLAISLSLLYTHRFNFIIKSSFFSLLFPLLILVQPMEVKAENISLPPVPVLNGLTELLQSRQSRRQFVNKPLTLEQLSGLLWAAGGKKVDGDSAASRTVPSAGATFPLEIYLAIGKDGVKGISVGIFHYLVDSHSLEAVSVGDKRSALAQSCGGQDFIARAPISLIICADYIRTTNRYGSRGIRYVHIEVGHSCQNVYLMAEDLGLATVEVGAFDDLKIKKLLRLKVTEEPLAVMPVGFQE